MVEQVSAEVLEAPVQGEEAPEEVQEAAPTVARKALGTMTTIVGAILPVRVEEAVDRLETGLESRFRTEEPVPEHREACLAATLEEVLLERLEDRLELVVQAAADGEEVPLGIT